MFPAREISFHSGQAMSFHSEKLSTRNFPNLLCVWVHVYFYFLVCLYLSYWCALKQTLNSDRSVSQHGHWMSPRWILSLPEQIFWGSCCHPGLVALLSLALLALASDPASTVMFTHFCFASEGDGLPWWGRYYSVREKKGNCENPYLLYLTLIFHQWETVVASPWANDCNYFRQDLRALPCLWLYLSSWNADTVRCFELEAYKLPLSLTPFSIKQNWMLFG